LSWIEGRAASVREALFGGVGAVRVWDALGATAAGPFRAALACELDPGGSVGRHRQQQFAELVIGIDGDGEVGVDRVARDLKAGVAVFVPFGAVLSIRNRSAVAPLRYLIVKAEG
jgi:quercetin dioxygenase-like cupin family protein